MPVSSLVIRYLMAAVCVTAAIACTHSTGLSDNLSADRPVVDYGTVPDSTSCLNHTFKLSNHSQDTCFIKRLSKGCGCITVEMDNNAIAPGQTAELTMNVDITGYYNHIEKPVYVYHSLSDKPLTLKLLADRPRNIPLTAYDYPYSPDGPLCFTTNIIFGGYVAQGGVYDATVIVYNESDKSLSLKRISTLPRHISVSVPKRVEARSIARITARFDFRQTGDLFGEYSSELRLRDGAGHIIPLQVYAVVTESFDDNSAASPRIHTPVYCYTLIDSDRDRDIISKTFRIGNVGDGDLILRSIDLSSDVASYDLSQEFIASGDEATLTVTIPKSSLGDGLKINIICNDPLEPFKQLSIEPE